MGSGKSLCSRYLGDILNREVISTDEEIERRERKPIADIFQQKGEAYFRELETRVVKDVCTMPEKIIDTGGGVVLNKENLDILKANGILIWLKASPETIWKNVNLVKRQRPLLDVEDPMAKIKELLAERTPFYSQADISLVTDGKSIRHICEEIVGLLS